MSAKIKIRLSDECVRLLVKNFDGLRVASSSEEEGREYGAAAEDLLWAQHVRERDKDRYLRISRKTLDEVLEELDWAYCNTDGGNV